MPSLGVNVAIVQNDKILLTRRVDFEVWCLPGGSVDENESLAQAAIRETREEVGLDVCLTRLVGLYSRPGWVDNGLHVAVFAAEVHSGVGEVRTGAAEIHAGAAEIAVGALRIQENEVLEARYFGRAELPEAMLLGHRQRALDALNGASGVVWFHDAEWPFPPETTRQGLYDLRDRSGLSKADFYLQFVGKPGPGGDVLEIG